MSIYLQQPSAVKGIDVHRAHIAECVCAFVLTLALASSLSQDLTLHTAGLSYD